MKAFPPDYPLVHHVRPSPNQDERAPGLATDILLLHYTGMSSTAAALERLCDPVARVSSHYVVDESGQITQLVPEARRAWHAGVSSWEGEIDNNSRSIGIEIGNVGHDLGYPDFPDVQIDVVIALCRDIIRRHRIRADRVLAHSDIAPQRKIDPGEKFPWARLHHAGVGLWVAPQKPSAPALGPGENGQAVADLQDALRHYGYGIEVTGMYDEATTVVVTAFQRHFRPARVDGRADRSTVAALQALLAARDDAASPCIEPSGLYDRSTTPSHRRVHAPAVTEFLVGRAFGPKTSEDHLVTRRLVLAARVAAVVLLGGIVLASIAIPLWTTFEKRAGEDALRKLGASVGEAKSGGLLVDLPTQISDDTLTKEGPHLEGLNIVHLNLPHSKLTSLEPLKGLTNLSSLDLSDAFAITSLEPLKGLTNLSSLDLSYATGITSLEPLKGLTNLNSLNLRNARGITSLEPLKGMTSLASLNLNGATGITSLEPLKGLTNLSWLDLTNATGITSLEPLKGMTKLTSLNLNSATGITSLEPLKGMTNLSSLDLSDAIGITSLEPLKGLTELSSLTLINVTGITSLEPLKGMTNLSKLYLNDAKGIKSLEPLKELGVQVYGASDELLATMN